MAMGYNSATSTERASAKKETVVNINELLRLSVEKGASDLHLNVPSPPVMRIDGELTPQEDLPAVTSQYMEHALEEVTTEDQRKIFYQELELDFAHHVRGIGRFRVNASVQKGTVSLCFRMIYSHVPNIDQLLLPDVCKTLAMRERGLILVTGPAGSGKSTTLAAMIEYLNERKRRRVVTIEDPIEYVHENKKCFISQREVSIDTWSFSAGLKHALRQDPDVILVGEIRDLETIATVLTAAETGHLVFTTLHTPSAPQAIDRVIDVFPPHQQQQARVQLSTTLEGIIYQTLIPRRDGTGRVAAVEIMIANDAVKNLIREAKTPQMWSVMQTGSQYGMQTMDQALLNLYNSRYIDFEDAICRCRDPETARKSIARASGNW